MRVTSNRHVRSYAGQERLVPVRNPQSRSGNRSRRKSVTYSSRDISWSGMGYLDARKKKDIIVMPGQTFYEKQ
jgi:hypothetical protein